MFKRILWGGVLLVALGLLVFGAIAWKPAIAPVTPPDPAGFSAELVSRGAQVAAAGYCATCHTAPEGAPLAGGYAFPSAFGTLYSTNITPDPTHGIGTWSEEALARAMRQGVARDGSHLYPAFPYNHFTLVTDEDLHALYAWLMSQAPEASTPPPNTVGFPFNVRALQAGWKLLFFREQRFTPVPGKGDAWNRGAYLAEGLAHCSSCHTPRNAVAAEKGGEHRYAGGFVDNWYAPALTEANTAPVPWTREALREFLTRGGTALHGVAAGSMSHVVHQGLTLLPPADVDAIALYFADMNGSEDRQRPVDEIVDKALADSAIGTSGQGVEHGAELYRVTCAYCHYNRDEAMPHRPELALNSALTAADPTNLIQVVLQGVSIEDGLPDLVMPPYGPTLTDQDIAQLLAYLRRTRTDLPPWPDLEQKIASLRAQADRA